MTRRPHDPHDIERLLRGPGRNPPPVARREFRDRLRADFTRAAVPERAPVRTPMSWPGPLRIAALATATAAVGVALFLGWNMNDGPAWRLMAVTGSGPVQIEGLEVAVDSPADLARALKPGVRVRVPEGTQLDFELPGVALVQIVGGSEATVPGRPGRWFGRSMTASLAAGEIRISTGPLFQGISFDVRTPEVRALVTGTTLAVFRQPDASCVCVFEGHVAMGEGAAVDTVRAGYRRLVFLDGRAPLVEPILPMESMKLSMLRDQADAALGH